MLPRGVLDGSYLFVACWLLAQTEIQIEGRHGWAENLPAWRINHPAVLRLTNGKPVTGYHFFLVLFLLFVFHMPLLFTGFSRPVEAKVLSFYFLLTISWDFQWFVWNPAWGIRRFFTDRIWWYPKKFLGFPVEYYTGAAASLLATALLWNKGLRQWLVIFGSVLVLNIMSVAAAEWSGWRPKV